MRFTTLMLFMLSLNSFVYSDFATLLEKHCLECHDADTAKGDIVLDALGEKVTKETAELWLKSLKQLDMGYMPPENKDQPSSHDRHEAILELEGELIAWSKLNSVDNSTVLRRLNKSEYRNTIRDVLKIENVGFDPTHGFPDDQLSHGFTSNGEALVTSSFLMMQYLKAAESSLDKAINFKASPKFKEWDLKPPFNKTTGWQMQIEKTYWEKQKVPQPFQTITGRMRGLPKSGYHPVDDLREAVKESGWYDIKISVEGKYRYAYLDQAKSRFDFEWDSTQPIRLSMYTGTLKGVAKTDAKAVVRAVSHIQAGERLLADWDLPDDKKVWLSCRVWLEEGEFLRFGFPNGPSNSNYRLTNYFKENYHILLDDEKKALYEKSIIKGSPNVHMFFESPRIQLYQLKMSGPHIEQWPPKSHQVIFGKESYKSKDAKVILKNFSERAWRRPVEDYEVEPFITLVRQSESKGFEPNIAIQEGLKAILCSSSFIFREERSTDLTNFEIASRLSYFLWSSMPDAELQRNAKLGHLNNPSVRREEALRLLTDARSISFVKDFLDGWIKLRDLGKMAPDVFRFRSYYRDNLESAMRLETELYFHYLLNTNAKIDQLIDSDFTFANDSLLKHYRMDRSQLSEVISDKVEELRPSQLSRAFAGDAPSQAFYKVPIKNKNRGGLLGHASILTLTSNGVETSPVTRGIWMLENFLGTPPSEPPSDVPAIEPDVRGATSVRDRLEKHRESKSCRSCHAHIDPPGFALENFNAIGEWRGHYKWEKGSPKIDASAAFNGKPFENVIGFKKQLQSRERQVAKNLTEKMLSHALGRELGVQDRPSVRYILDNAAKEGYRIKDLLLLCVESPLFEAK